MTETVITIVLALGGVGTLFALALFMLRIVCEETFEAIDEKVAEKIRGKDGGNH